MNTVKTIFYLVLLVSFILSVGAKDDSSEVGGKGKETGEKYESINFNGDKKQNMQTEDSKTTDRNKLAREIENSTGKFESVLRNNYGWKWINENICAIQSTSVEEILLSIVATTYKICHDLDLYSGSHEVFISIFFVAMTAIAFASVFSTPWDVRALFYLVFAIATILTDDLFFGFISMAYLISTGWKLIGMTNTKTDKTSQSEGRGFILGLCVFSAGIPLTIFTMFGLSFTLFFAGISVIQLSLAIGMARQGAQYQARLIIISFLVLMMALILVPMANHYRLDVKEYFACIWSASDLKDACKAEYRENLMATLQAELDRGEFGSLVRVDVGIWVVLSHILVISRLSLPAFSKVFGTRSRPSSKDSKTQKETSNQATIIIDDNIRDWMLLFNEPNVIWPLLLTGVVCILFPTTHSHIIIVHILGAAFGYLTSKYWLEAESNLSSKRKETPKARQNPNIMERPEVIINLRAMTSLIVLTLLYQWHGLIVSVTLSLVIYALTAMQPTYSNIVLHWALSLSYAQLVGPMMFPICLAVMGINDIKPVAWILRFILFSLTLIDYILFR